MVKKSSKKSKKSIKSRRVLLGKKIKKYATPSNIYKALLLSGTLGIIGASIYKKKINSAAKAVSDQAELVQNLHTIKKDIEECRKNLSEMKNEEAERLEKYNAILKERTLVNQEKARVLSKTLSSITKNHYRVQPSRGRVVGTDTRGGCGVCKGGARGGTQSQSLFSLGQELEKCKKLREDHIKAFVEKVSAIEDKIKLAEKLSDEYKFKLMKTIRQHR